MKPLFSWLLIAIIACHWVSCHIGFKVIYFTELESKMDKVETAIAKAVQDETNLETHITVLTKDQIPVRGNGYGNFHVFSKEIDGQIVYYQIDPTPIKLVAHESSITSHPNPDEHEKMLIIESLFSKYTIPKFLLSMITPAVFFSKSGYIVTNLLDQFPLSILTPPPEFA